jgi:dephospho-CoA kinase
VSAPLEGRIQRVIERDKTTQAVLKRINAQWSDGGFQKWFCYCECW